jgi:hypothetical protein
MVEYARKYSQICDVCQFVILLGELKMRVKFKCTYAEPALAVLGLHLVAVGHPVTVPPPEGGRVVNTDGVDVLDLESGRLQLVDEEAERGRCIGTREDVLVHEQAPNEILVLPRATQTRNLQEEDTIVVHHVINLLKESLKEADADVLSHLETSDLVVTTLGNRDIAVVHAQNLALLLGDARLTQRIVSPRGLVAAQSDTSHLGIKVAAGESSKSTPSTANVQELLALLEANLLTHDSELVVLELLKRLLLVDVGDDARRVDHARAKKPSIEIVTAVVVVTDLLLVYPRR